MERAGTTMYIPFDKVNNIGFISTRLSGTDGVSLETEKWIDVLKEMGHDIYIVAGRFTAHLVVRSKETHMPMLCFFSPECEWEQKRAFFYPDEDPEELLSHLKHASDVVAMKMRTGL